jgi:hypothetical protein
MELSGLRRLQWCWVRFDKECVPVRVLHIELRWLVASGPSIDEVCTWLSRRAKQAGLVEIPSSTGSLLFNAELQANTAAMAGISLQPDPFLNIINFKLPSPLVRRLVLLRLSDVFFLFNQFSSILFFKLNHLILNSNSLPQFALLSRICHRQHVRRNSTYQQLQWLWWQQQQLNWIQWPKGRLT